MKCLCTLLAGGCVAFLGLATVSLSGFGAVIYDDLSEFHDQLEPGYYLVDFESFSHGTQPAGSVDLSGGTPTFNYTIAAQSGSLYVVDHSTLPSGKAMSTVSTSVDLVITFTSGNVTAVGADFFLTAELENLIAGNLTVMLNDGTSVNLSSPGSGPVPFRGFTTSAANPITSLTIQPGSEYATFDNLYVGQVIPEGPTWMAAVFLMAVVLVQSGRALLARKSKAAGAGPS